MLIQCPHCDQYIEIIALNCAIFRCGIYKQNYEQIPPHLPELQCRQLIESNLIFGCGRPFKILNDIAIICEYI